MGKFAKKPKVFNGKKSRKTIRKEQRLDKKKRKQDYYVNRTKGGKFVLANNNKTDSNVVSNKKDKQSNEANKLKNKNKASVNKTLATVDTYTQEVINDKRRQKKLENEMKKQRKKQLQVANIEEDKIIKRLEKDLKLNKRKSKSVPKSFETDGLNYLLEVCDPENIKNVVSSEQQFMEGNDDFEEDFALISGKTKKKSKLSKEETSDDDSEKEEIEDTFFKSTKNKKSSKNNDNEEFSGEDSDIEAPVNKKRKIKFEDELNSDFSDENNSESDLCDLNTDSDNDVMETKAETKKNKVEKLKLKNERQDTVKNKKDNKSYKEIDEDSNSEDFSDIDEFGEEEEGSNPASNSDYDDVDFEESEDDIGTVNNTNNKENIKQQKSILKKSNENKKESKTIRDVKKNAKKTDSIEDEYFSEEQNSDNSEENSDDEENKIKNNSDSDVEDTWEDIYGRKRTKDGEIIQTTQNKYIPPALRNQADPKRSEKLIRLKKQLKGLLNRLAESNMHSISSQIEELYMNNSRNDMNETMTQLIFESLISVVHTPERLLLEHVMLIAILHANVGTEVGATFLLNVVKKFDELLKLEDEVENKELDNTVHIIAQLYNFKVFHAQLLYQILAKLAEKFEEKHVECILLVLKNVGFSLRKDDPIALKQIILDLQKRASTVPDDNSRVKFMLDILLAIKNNNVTKIPNYDTTYSEHLKKLIKGFIRKGNYVTQLNISLEDLLKADERGKWWVVGSAWSGMEDKKQDKEEDRVTMPTYSKKLLELAKKQRMNTDTRRNIFCIIMTAEDYLDAFEKLLHLGLKNQQEREIIHVILHCCLQEKNYNPYYAVLAEKFCEYDRRFQMTVRCSIWDKLKALTDCSGAQLTNMAKLLAHLFIQQGLPISTLKVIEFGELDKITLRFMRQVLLSVLLHEDEEACLTVFNRVATSPKLKMFRDSLRLFIHHFLLRNLKEGMIEEQQKELLTRRAQLIEKSLITSESRSHFD